MISDRISCREGRVNEMEKEYSGRILLRIPPYLHKQASECAANAETTLNDFIMTSIMERIDRLMTVEKAFERVVIAEQKIKDVREAVIVTQHPWYMEIFNRHKVYFFNPKLGKVTPMQYILCYETTLENDRGFSNVNPRHIAKWGKVKEILFGISPSSFVHVPELVPLTQDKSFWPEISSWENTNVVLLEEIGDFRQPLPLKNGLEARYLVNKTSDLVKLRNAHFIDELY
jgi:uncharacterized protein (DUF1778 family)